MSEEFERVYESQESEAAHRELSRLAKQYHQETEYFDRAVCTGPIIRGGIMPATGSEHAAINKNASAVRERLFYETLKLGFSEKQWIQAIKSNCP